MKTLLKFILVILVLNAFLSCSKDEAPDPKPVAQSDPDPNPDPIPDPDPEPEIQYNAMSFDGVDDYVELDTLASALSKLKRDNS